MTELQSKNTDVLAKQMYQSVAQSASVPKDGIVIADVMPGKADEADAMAEYHGFECTDAELTKRTYEVIGA